MSQSEFEAWSQYYDIAPFDDLHRYHRPAALIAGSMSSGKIGDMIEWLENTQANAELTDADIATLKAFGMSPRSIKNGQ